MLKNKKVVSYDVVDADGHIMEPRDLWGGQYMPASHRGKGPIPGSNGYLEYPDGTPFPYKIRVGPIGSRPQGSPEAGQPLSMHGGAGRKGGYDPHSRIDDLDLDKIDAAVIYPTIALSLAWVEDDAGLAGAMARAYNTWLADYCRPYPDRLFGAALMPMVTVDGAIAEMRYAREHLGMRAVAVRPTAFKARLTLSGEWDMSTGRLRLPEGAPRGRTLASPEMDAFWAAAQDLDMAIGIHGGGAYPDPQAGQDRFPNDSISQHIVMHPFEQMLACTGLIMSGVFERFPKLRVGFLESGGGWAASLMDRMDRHFVQEREKLPLTMAPSDYFRKNCWISFEPVEGNLSLLADYIGADHCLWATDYPHGDGFFPGAPDMIRQLPRLSEESKSKILGEGARKLYELGKK